MAEPNVIDDYLASVSEDQRAALESVRRLIRNSVPQAEEVISYGLPAFRLKDRPLVAFGAAKNHCAFYPMSPALIEANHEALRTFSTSKGTIRFQPESPIPDHLIEEMVRARIEELGISQSD